MSRPANDQTQNVVKIADKDELSKEETFESQKQPPIIYVELARSVSPKLLFDDASTLESNVSSDQKKLMGYLNDVGIEAMEYSFSVPFDGVPDREQFLTLHFGTDKDVNDICRTLLTDHKVILQAFPATGLIPPFPESFDPFEEPLLGSAIPGSEQNTQWYIFRCKIHKAWRALSESNFVSGKGVVVADIDWGFLTTHRDLGLKQRIKVTRNTTDPMDPDNVSQGSLISHGTAVLGLVGASGTNREGMVGVSFGADLWAIQAGKKFGDLNVRDWVSALDFVRDRDSQGKRKVIILEVETIQHDNIETQPCINKAIVDAIAAGAIVCVAAGNGGRNAGVNILGHSIPRTGAIVVGATEFAEQENPLHPQSNHGCRVTVYAPGAELGDLTCSSEDNDVYTNRFGRTSGATPKVAGTVALMLEVNPNLSSCQIKDILRETGSTINSVGNLPAGIFLDSEAAVREALRLV